MTATITGPVGVIGWDVSDEVWREARKRGLGGSDISAVLGFSTYRSPWAVWAEKTGVRSWQDDESSAAADLGIELEPWLLAKTARILGVPVRQTAFRTYAHPLYTWRTCSPDGICDDGTLVELKTAGLASGYGPPPGWAEGGTPLGYEFQCRWSMHVMDAARIELVGLVAGMGVVHRTFDRDLTIEADLVDQVSAWHQRHVVEGEEPALGAVDNDLMARLYPRATDDEIDLTGTEAAELQRAYRAALARESAAKADKETAGAALKRLLGENSAGRVGEQVIAKWSAVKGKVDWPAVVADLVETHGVPAPNPESYRKPSTRSLHVKEA